MSERTMLMDYDVGCVRVCTRTGAWWLCNHRAKGPSSFVYEYPTLAALRAAWAVDLGALGVDAAGAYWATRRPL